MVVFVLLLLAGVQSQPLPFLTTWRTTSANEYIQLPLSSLASPINITWNQGGTSQMYDNSSQFPIRNLYPTAGLHNMSILGTMTGFRFASQGHATKLVDILSWGDSFIMDGTSTYAFSGCVNLQVSAPPNSQPVFAGNATLQGMFANSSFNSALNWSLTNVQSVAEMFRGAAQLNQPITFTNTDDVRIMTDMFSYAYSFNQAVNLDTRNVLQMDYVFDSASSFNQPINFNTSSATTMTGMFYDAIKFNQPVNFDTRNVVTMDMMFLNASSFNQPVNFITDKVVGMNRMFSQAPKFNQPINFNTSKVNNMRSMFSFSTSFNQPIDFQIDTLFMAAQMFEGATSFNQPVVLRNSNRLTSTSRMFANANKCFNNTVNISSTANVTDMAEMFLGVVGFQQSLDHWNTTAVTNCSGFCPTCGLPTFPSCSNPCGAGAKISTGVPPATLFVCSLPDNTCVPPPNLCLLVNVSANLQVQCLPNSTATAPPTPGGGGGGGGGGGSIISPLFNITKDDGDEHNTSTFVFTLPIDPVLYEVGKVTQACQGGELSCEWQDPDSLEFRQSGCAVSNARVDLGSGIVGTQCTCTHLTVFAIVLRPQLKAAPLCHAQEIDYALLALYGALTCVLLLQTVRVMSLHLYKSSLPQHLLLLLTCVLRVVYLVLKPIIGSLAGLVLLGLLPSAMALTLFIHLLLVWASLQLSSVQLSSPFAKFRLPFIAISFMLFALAIVLAVVVTVAPFSGNEIEIVRDGSYLFAALTALVCVFVLISGLGLYRSLGAIISHNHSSASHTSPSSAHATSSWRDQIRRRLLLATVGLAVCLFVVACLWAAAVQTDILVSSAATLATSGSFYFFDWLSLCVMTWMFSTAVKRAAAEKSRTQESQW